MNGYVAVDQFEFQQSDECNFEPKDAWPEDPTTTPSPTEPPDSKYTEIESLVNPIYFDSLPICLIWLCMKKKFNC